MTCGDKIKELRKNLKMTQSELGSKIGVTYATISKYEKNEISIPSETLKVLAKVLETSTDYLLGISKNEKYEKHQIAFFNGVENLSDADKVLVQNLIDSLKNKNK